MVRAAPRLPCYDPTLSGTEGVLRELELGMAVERLDSRHKIRRRTLTLMGNNMGLSYSPSRWAGRREMLFRDVFQIFVEDSYTKTYRKAKLKPENDRIVNICPRTGRCWRLVFHDLKLCDVWMNAIALILKRRESETQDSLERDIRALWERADRNMDGVVSPKEVKALFSRVNLFSSNDAGVRQLMDTFDASGDGKLDFGEFRRLYLHLMDCPRVRAIYRVYARSDPDAGMSLSEFERFLRQQGDPVTAGRSYFLKWGIQADQRLSFFVFSSFLFDVKNNSVLDPKAATITDDMDQPLTHYFINSSHNTYLTGNQFTSSSSVDMYRDALLSGCRCVEIDCWGKCGNDAEVRHGYTLTSKIGFEDVIKTVNDYAFQSSDLPVILSLEVHTSPEVSGAMARILRSVLGKKLVMAEEVPEVAYTPNGLRGRVLVKWKMPNWVPTNDIEGEQLNESMSREEGSFSHPAVLELSRCVSMGACKTASWGKDAKACNVQSYSEVRMLEIAKNSAQSMQLQNTRMLSRVYPKGGRLFSSNYDPMVPWSLGCQMVALNFQSWDESHRINDAMFTQNSGCGYVLKPSFLINPQGGARPTSYKLHVGIICGAWLPRPQLRSSGDILDPYVRLKLIGPDVSRVVRTKTVRDNGSKPVWDEAVDLQGTCAELEILTISVWDENTGLDEPVCDAHIPVRLIRHGYRAVPMRLCSSGLRLRRATVLCHFHIDF